MSTHSAQTIVWSEWGGWEDCTISGGRGGGAFSFWVVYFFSLYCLMSVWLTVWLSALLSIYIQYIQQSHSEGLSVVDEAADGKKLTSASCRRRAFQSLYWGVGGLVQVLRGRQTTHRSTLCITVKPVAFMENALCEYCSQKFLFYTFVISWSRLFLDMRAAYRHQVRTSLWNRIYNEICDDIVTLSINIINILSNRLVLFNMIYTTIQ